MGKLFVEIPILDIRRSLRNGKIIMVAHLMGRMIYRSDLYKLTITIPQEFVSDGASVPQIFWNICPPIDNYLEACIVHDWLCVTKLVNSVVAANIFKEAMLDLNITNKKAWFMWKGVRWFGPRFEGKKV